MSEPNIYEAVTAYATAATAVPAMVAAYFGWLQVRQQVLLETTQTLRKPLHESSLLELTVTIRNRRRTSILPWGVEVIGLPGVTVTREGHRKGPNWSDASVALHDEIIEPGNSREFEVIIRPDWAAALARARRDQLPWRLVVRYEDCARNNRRWRTTLRMRFGREQVQRHQDRP